MISAYFKELKRYTQTSLCEMLCCSNEEIVPIIRKLKEFNVLKAVSATDAQRDMTELAEEDIVIAEVNENENALYYVFSFVGVIVVAGRVLKCYPKYIATTAEPKDELCQLMKVLEKFNAKEQIIHFHTESDEDVAFNLLALLTFLLEDYYENDVYINTEDIIENNGSGEILWDKTINETFALISRNRPYYIDLLTKKRRADEYDYFTRLHKCILTKAAKELQEADLLDLFGIAGVDLSDETLEDFGSSDYILYRIENELSTQFNTRKQLVLKAIYTYINHNGSLFDVQGLSLFGTTCFYDVWEKISAEVLHNLLETRLIDIPLPVPLRTHYNGEARLIDIIEKPLWTATGLTADKTLIPDFITIAINDNNEYTFIILDAKYYVPKLEQGRSPKGQPGIESITKQYLYQLAYKHFIEEHEFTSVKNCFLLPTEGPAVENCGQVVLQMLSGLGLQDIEVRKIPAKTIYNNYLSGTAVDINILNL